MPQIAAAHIRPGDLINVGWNAWEVSDAQPRSDRWETHTFLAFHDNPGDQISANECEQSDTLYGDYNYPYRVFRNDYLFDDVIRLEYAR